MRLDKFLAHNLQISRKEAKILLATGQITINELIVKLATTKISADDRISIAGKKVTTTPDKLYFMLNKPPNLVCTHDRSDNIFRLFKELQNKLHAVGRLDIDTTGLILLTNDGNFTHKITSPKKQCAKVYQVTIAHKLTEQDLQILEQGILLKGENKITKPAQIKILADNKIELTITEGRYHQVKRMLAFVNNKVLALHRVQIGALKLDPNLQFGEFRPLTEKEIAIFD